MKRAVVFLLMLAILITPTGIVGAADGAVVSLESKTAHRGDTVTMELKLENNPGIASVTVSVNYDAEALTLDKVENGSLFGVFDYGATTHRMAWMAANNVTENGVLATLTFTVADDAPIETCNVTVTVEQCFDEEYRDIPASTGNGAITIECIHDNGAWKTTKEASCTEAGSEERKCTICDTVLETREIAAKGHTYGEWITEKEPDCTEAGKEQRTCSVCQATETREIPAKGHTWESDFIVDVEPTCTQDGSQHRVCSICKYVETQVIPAAHQFGEWETVKEATCTEAGSEEATCSVCQVTETREIPATGHIWEDDFTVDKEPTATEAGSKSIHCKNCEEVKNVTAIPAAEATADSDSSSDAVNTSGEDSPATGDFKPVTALIILCALAGVSLLIMGIYKKRMQSTK